MYGEQRSFRGQSQHLKVLSFTSSWPHHVTVIDVLSTGSGSPKIQVKGDVNAIESSYIPDRHILDASNLQHYRTRYISR